MPKSSGNWDEKVRKQIKQSQLKSLQGPCRAFRLDWPSQRSPSSHVAFLLKTRPTFPLGMAALSQRHGPIARLQLFLRGWSRANPSTCLRPGPSLLWKERWVWGCALVNGTQTFSPPFSSPPWSCSSERFPYISSYSLLPTPSPSSGLFQAPLQPQHHKPLISHETWFSTAPENKQSEWAPALTLLSEARGARQYLISLQ